MSNIIFSDDCIRTVDIWCRKQPLYQPSHNTAEIYVDNAFYIILWNKIVNCVQGLYASNIELCCLKSQFIVKNYKTWQSCIRRTFILQTSPEGLFRFEGPAFDTVQV